MEKQKITNAGEARKLAELRAITTEQVLVNIEVSASNGGMAFVCFGFFVPIEVQQDLIRLGFSIRMQRDQMGFDQIVVSW